MATLGQRIARNAHWYPNKEAFIYGDRRVTYAEYALRARKLASALHKAGIRRQERVAIYAMNCLEYLDVFAAGEVAGIITTPINFRMAPPEVAWILKDSSACVLVFEAQYAAVVEQLRPQFSDIRLFVCIGGPAPSWAIDFDRLLASGDDVGPPELARDEDYAYLFYTSGTTGRPKGVLTTHGQMHGLNASSVLGYEMTIDARSLVATPLFHVGGKGFEWSAAFRSATVVLHRAFDPVQTLETIQRERITHMFMVAAMVQAVLDVPNVESYDLSSLRFIMSAAAPIPIPLLKRASKILGPAFAVAYGSTEGGHICTLYPSEVHPDGCPDDIHRLASVGHPAPGVELRIADDEGNDCPVGQPGEVLIQSTGVMAGYWNNTAATIEALRDGWFHTGDLGYQDAQGFVFLVDRKKDMIISGGENIYSREVEEALVSHPAVIEAAVIGIPDPKWGEAVKAVVVCKPGMTPGEAELIVHCRSQIASYKCPKTVEIVTELPRVPSGKINKVALREQAKSAGR